jgi:GTP-binding protein EngB required for normal cell division
MGEARAFPPFLLKEVRKYLHSVKLFINCWNRTDYESVVVLGRTGVGKSFTLNMITRQVMRIIINKQI